MKAHKAQSQGQFALGQMKLKGPCLMTHGHGLVMLQSKQISCLALETRGQMCPFGDWFLETGYSGVQVVTPPFIYEGCDGSGGYRQQEEVHLTWMPALWAAGPYPDSCCWLGCCLLWDPHG